LTTSEKNLLTKAYNVTNPKEFVKAQDLLVKLKTTKAEIERRVKRIKDPLNQARAEILALERDMVQTITARISDVTFAIREWRDAEACRLITQQTAAGVAELEAAAQVAETPAEAAVLTTLADDLRSAEGVRDGAIALPELEGLTEVTKWKADVTDLRAFLQSVLDGKAGLECVSVNPTPIHKLADQFKELLSEAVPGLTPRKERDFRRV